VQTYTLSRTGDVPLKFEGEHLAGISTQQGPGGKDRNRWYEVDLYRTRGGKYVLKVHFMTLWQGEQFVIHVILCDDTAGVRKALIDFDPTRDAAGYPPGEAYVEKQARLERGLRSEWAAGIRDLFEGLETEFAEEIA
jgi:arylamine N-acetyltransferase